MRHFCANLLSILSLHTLHPIVVEMALLADQFLATRLNSSQHPVTPIQGTCYLFLTSVGTCIYVRYSNTNTHTYTAKTKNNIFKILCSEGIYIMKISS